MKEAARESIRGRLSSAYAGRFTNYRVTDDRSQQFLET